jgi:hypothetical protein
MDSTGGLKTGVNRVIQRGMEQNSCKIKKIYEKMK